MYTKARLMGFWISKIWWNKTLPEQQLRKVIELCKFVAHPIITSVAAHVDWEKGKILKLNAGH